MIKLIASDIDGTLVPDGSHEMNPELYDVIIKLREKGIQFAAASGRHWASIESIFKPIQEKIFYISDNGAYIGCHGRNLFLNTIERQTVMEMIATVRKIDGLELMVSGPDVVYLETRDQEFIDRMVHGYKFQVKQVEDICQVDSAFIKISVYRKSDVENHTRSLRKKYEDRLKITIAGTMWMDCMKPGISKGQALKLLQDSLEIRPEETMVFGDQLNDIEMLQQAYYSFAVGNARTEVKEAARFQTDVNKRDGVLKILKLLL
jgi:hypothetical protein